MLTGRLPSRIESSATKRLVYSTEIVETDGGNEFRNARWADPRAEWDCSIPPVKRTSDEYLETTALFDAAIGSFDSFMFHDPIDCVDVAVRFKDDTLEMTGAGNLVTLRFTLIEDR